MDLKCTLYTINNAIHGALQTKYDYLWIIYI